MKSIVGWTLIFFGAIGMLAIAAAWNLPDLVVIANADVVR